jgi:DNA-binding PadR family transcriptional regulator
MMVGLRQEPMGARVTRSTLEFFILSQLDRGLQTPYDLLQQGGLSLGSTVPALRRLEKAGLVRKKAAPAGSSRRPRHGYELSTAGRKLARSGWIPLLKGRAPADLDAVLRLADLADHYQTELGDVAAFLETAASERRPPRRASGARRGAVQDSLGLMITRESWDAIRLRAEGRFLAGLARSLRRRKAKSPKH